MAADGDDAMDCRGKGTKGDVCTEQCGGGS